MSRRERWLWVLVLGLLAKEVLVPLAAWAQAKAPVAAVSTGAETFQGAKNFSTSVQSPAATLGFVDGGTAVFTPTASQALDDTSPVIYIPTTASNQYAGLKIGGDVGNPNSNWGWTLGIYSGAPLLRSRASGLQLDLAGNGALFPTSDAASDLGKTSNRFRALYLSDYPNFQKTFAGAPTAGDCDAAGEIGRISIDTTNHRFYWCEGAGGWKYAAGT